MPSTPPVATLPKRLLLSLLVVAGAAVTLWASSGPAEAKREAQRSPAAAQGDVSARGPIGYQTFRGLDKLPLLQTGNATRQFSGFDRKGANDDGFAGTFSCLRMSTDGCVIADRKGAGEIDSIWFTRDEGDVTGTGKIKVQLDGKTVLDASLQDVVDGKLPAPFKYPLVANADQTSGGVYIRVPMPYRRSMRVTMENNPLFQHVAYRSFASAKGVETFDPKDPARDVLRTLRGFGKRDPKPQRRNSTTKSRSFKRLAPGRSVQLADLKGAATISELRLRIPQIIGPPEIPRVHDDGRAFGANGYSEFKAKIDPANQGVRLTRRLASNIGNQRADVLVDGQKVGEWKPIAPTGEGFSDQTVDIPASATAGKSEITIRNSFVSSDLDFNEFTYWVDSVVGGQAKRTDTMDLGQEHAAEEAAHSYKIVGQLWEGVRDFPYVQTPEEAAKEAARYKPSDELLRDVRVRVSFDGRRSVDAPLGEFFGTGLGEYEVRSLMSSVSTAKNGSYRSWWPMPYGRRAKVSLYNGSDHAITGGDGGVTYGRDRGGMDRRAGYFRAISHYGRTTPGKDWVFADVKGHGKFVGVHHTMWGIGDGDGGPFTNIRGYLEGDERVYVDGARSPQMHGTGSEDFYEGGWYFNRGSVPNPFIGNTAHEQANRNCEFSCDSALRYMLGESVSYEKGLRFSIEHGPEDDADATYGSTAFTYAQRRPVLRRSDVIDVGKAGSERSHHYRGGGAVTPLTSVFEGDFDDVQVSDEGRSTAGRVAFTGRTKRSNSGVRLVRRSDQAKAYQAARVLVNGRSAGIWSQPLHNETQRWLEDSFELPARLTKGRRKLRIKLLPVAGKPAWSAARYEVLTRGRGR